MVKVAVTGATGLQGGAVVEALMASGQFEVRGITRNTGSDAAKKLVERGVEVVHGDFDKPETLKDAFAGCHSVFLVTNFWEHLNPQREIDQAVAAAEAAAAAGATHIIWSALEDTRPLLQGGEDVPVVPHFDAKAAATAAMRAKGLPVTPLITACYADNFLTYFRPHKQEDGSFAIAMPDMGASKAAWVSTRDIGKAAAALIAKGYAACPAEVAVTGEHLGPADCVAINSEVTGTPITFAGMPFDAYQAMLSQFMPAVGALDMANMFKYFTFKADAVAALRPVEATHALVPDAQTFRQWAQANKAALNAALV